MITNYTRTDAMRLLQIMEYLDSVITTKSLEADDDPVDDTRRFWIEWRLLGVEDTDPNGPGRGLRAHRFALVFEDKSFDEVMELAVLAVHVDHGREHKEQDAYIERTVLLPGLLVAPAPDNKSMYLMTGKAQPLDVMITAFKRAFRIWHNLLGAALT